MAIHVPDKDGNDKLLEKLITGDGGFVSFIHSSEGEIFRPSRVIEGKRVPRNVFVRADGSSPYNITTLCSVSRITGFDNARPSWIELQWKLPDAKWSERLGSDTYSRTDQAADSTTGWNPVASGLSPRTTYNLRARGVWRGQIGNRDFSTRNLENSNYRRSVSYYGAWTEATVTTARAPTESPDAPTIHALQFGQTTGRLTFIPRDANITRHYRVQISTSSSYSASTTTTIIQVEGGFVDFANLQEDTRYYVRIRAENDNGNSTWVSRSGNTQKSDANVVEPGVPIEPESASQDTDSITIFWNPPIVGDPPDSYEIQWRIPPTSYGSTTRAVLGASLREHTITGLRSGTSYDWRIRAVNRGGVSNWVVGSQTTRSSLQIPNPPENVDADAINLNNIVVSWDEPTTDQEAVSSYRIEWGESEDNYTNADEVDAGVEQLFYNIRLSVGSAGRTYYVRVRSQNRAGNSAWVTTNVTTPKQASCPTVTTLDGATQTDALAFSYVKKRYKFNLGANVAERMTRIAYSSSTATGTIVVTSALGDIPNGLSFSGSGIHKLTGTTTKTGSFDFTVYGELSQNRNCIYSIDVTIDVSEPADAPNPPTNITVTPSATSAVVNWDAASTGDAADSFDIRWGQGTSFGTPVNTTATAHTISGLTAGRTYNVEIRAKNDEGNSGWARQSFSTQTNLPSPPNVPRNLMASAASHTQIDVAWDSPTGGGSVDNYTIESRRKGVSVWDMNTTTNRTVSFTNLTPTTTYEYRVRANNRGGNSSFTASVEATTADEPPVRPSVVRNLTGTGGTTVIDVDWNEPTTANPAVSSYEVQWRTGTGEWESANTVATEYRITSYNGSTLRKATAYAIRVRGSNTAGQGDWQNISVSTQAPATSAPGVPVGLALIDSTETSLLLDWAKPASGGAVDDYEIEWGITGYEVGDATTTLEGYSLFGLRDATSYNVRVRARNNIGNSAWVNRVFRTAASTETPDSVSNLRATPNGPTAIRVTWDAPSILTGGTATRYEIEWGAGSYTDSAEIFFFTTYNISGLQADTSYDVRVTPKNSQGSGPSSEVTTFTGGCLLAFNPITALETDIGTAFTPKLPTTRFGVGDITYSVKDAPSGTTYNAATHKLEGNTNKAGSGTFTLVAEDTAGCTAEVEIPYNVKSTLAFAAETVTGVFTKGTEGTLALTAPTGNVGTLSYSLTGTLPDEITFDTSDAEFTINADSNSKHTFTVTATDTVSGVVAQTASQTVTITLSNLSLPATGSVEHTVGTSGTYTLAEATGGTMPIVYSTGTLSTGVTFNASSRELSVASTVSLQTITISYIATDSVGGVSTQTLSVNVIAPAIRLSRPISWERLRNGTSFTYTMPDVANKTSAAGATYTYRLNGLPNGLSFNASTRQISGRTNVPTNQIPLETQVTYTIIESAGPPWGTRSFSQTIPMFVLAPCNLTVDPIADISALLAPNLDALSAILEFLPEGKGGSGNYRYSISGTYPASLQLDESIRRFAGILTHADVGIYRATYRVEDIETFCVETRSFTIIVETYCGRLSRVFSGDISTLNTAELEANNFLLASASASWTATPTQVNLSLQLDEAGGDITVAAELVSWSAAGQSGSVGVLDGENTLVGNLTYITRVDDVEINPVSGDSVISFTLTPSGSYTSNLGIQPTEGELNAVIDENPYTLDIVLDLAIKITASVEVEGQLATCSTDNVDYTLNIPVEISMRGIA